MKFFIELLFKAAAFIVALFVIGSVFFHDDEDNWFNN